VREKEIKGKCRNVKYGGGVLPPYTGCRKVEKNDLQMSTNVEKD